MPRKGEAARPDDRIRVMHMVEAGREAMTFAAGRERADLDTDRQLLRALTHCVQEIGEAAGKVTPVGRA